MAALAAAGCSAAHASGPALAVPAAYVQMPSSGNSTVGYLDIRNNGTSDTLTSVSTSVGGTVQLRGPLSDDVSPVVMHTVTTITIPGGTESIRAPVSTTTPSP